MIININHQEGVGCPGDIRLARTVVERRQNNE